MSKIYKPAFTLGGIVPSELVVGRKREFAQLEQILLKEKGNALLIGAPRIGKGSLLQKLMDGFKRTKVVYVYVDLRIYYDRHITFFLQESLSELCRRIGAVVFEKTTSDMLWAVRKKTKSLDGEYNRLLEIYRCLKAQEASLTQEGGLELNASAGFAGGKGQRTDTAAYKFSGFSAPDLSLIRDLETLCRKKGFERIVIILDEANNLAITTSYEMLQSYLAAFKQPDTRIPFVFVATPNIVSAYPKLEKAFDRVIRVKPFELAQDVRDLLLGYYNAAAVSDVPFTRESEETIFWASKGHPYLCQILCAGSIDVANLKNHEIVTSEDVLVAFVKAIHEDESLVTFWN